MNESLHQLHLVDYGVYRKEEKYIYNIKRDKVLTYLLSYQIYPMTFKTYKIRDIFMKNNVYSYE